MIAIMNIMKNNKKVSELRHRTCFSSISYFGYKLDILKSAMQKYLRRREFDKMLWCVAEIYLFQVYADDDKKKQATKGIISNLINRIIVMLDEEMLFIEVEKYLLTRRYIKEFEDSGRSEFIALVKVCDIMVNSRMLRRNSDIRSHFDHRIKANPDAMCKPLVEKGNLDDDDYCFKNFVENFKMKNPDCYSWMFKILHRGVSGKTMRFRRKENIYMVWEYLFSLKEVRANKAVKKCLEYKLKEFMVKNRKERFIFLTSCIDLLLYVDRVPEISQTTFKAIKKHYDEKYSDVEGTLKNLYSDRVVLEIDDYAIDMHTSLGRRLKKNKADFATEGSLVINEDKEFYVDEWRSYYNDLKMKQTKAKLEQDKAKADKKIAAEKAKQEKAEKKAAKKAEKKAVKKTEKDVKKTEKKAPAVEGGGNAKSSVTSRAKLRSAKSKMIKKMRGTPKFDELEKDLEFVEGCDPEKIMLCTLNTCGNKVMCFEYEGKIWKEGRKSMNYNRDYCVLDECKQLFGLEKIGMKRVLSNFRIEKVDKSKKSWMDNWHKVEIKEGDEPVVYCVMDKVYPGEEVGKHKKKMLGDRRMLKEFVKIGVFRGIFRASDFNGRNVLTKDGDKLVSIDEGDIGKRLDIIGGREKWLIKALNKDKTIIGEIKDELFGTVGRAGLVVKKMKEYKFSDELCDEIIKNWNSLRDDLEKEGIEF